MQTSAAALACDEPSDAETLVFHVSASSASLMAALVKALLEQVVPDAQVRVSEATSARLKPGDVAIEQRLTGRSLVIFGSEPTHESVAEHLRAGAFSMICVDASAEELTTAIVSLSNGAPLVSTSIVRALTSRLAEQPGDDVHVTVREHDVLRLLCEGFSNTEIADRLSVSPNTVRSHLQSLSSKFGVRSRSKLVARAQSLGIA